MGGADTPAVVGLGLRLKGLAVLIGVCRSCRADGGRWAVVSVSQLKSDPAGAWGAVRPETRHGPFEQGMTMNTVEHESGNQNRVDVREAHHEGGKPEHFGKLLRRMMDERGLSQAGLAALAGMSRETVKRVTRSIDCPWKPCTARKMLIALAQLKPLGSEDRVAFMQLTGLTIVVRGEAA